MAGRGGAASGRHAAAGGLGRRAAGPGGSHRGGEAAAAGAVGLTAVTAEAQNGTVGVSWSNFQEERWKTDEAAIKGRLEELGYDYVSADAQSSAAKQLSDIEALIARGADALIVLAQDAEAIKPAVQQAAAAGILRDLDLHVEQEVAIMTCKLEQRSSSRQSVPLPDDTRIEVVKDQEGIALWWYVWRNARYDVVTNGVEPIYIGKEMREIVLGNQIDVILYKGNFPIGVARLTLNGDTANIAAVAVLKEARNPDTLRALYQTGLNTAADRGFLDDVIEPPETRPRLVDDVGELQHLAEVVADGVEAGVIIQRDRKGVNDVGFELGELIGVIKKQFVGFVEGDFVQILDHQQQVVVAFGVCVEQHLLNELVAVKDQFGKLRLYVSLEGFFEGFAGFGR